MMIFVLLKHGHSYHLNIIAIWHKVHSTILINTVHLLFTLSSKTVIGCLERGKHFRIAYVSLAEWSKVSVLTHHPHIFPIILYMNEGYWNTPLAWFVIHFTIFKQITANKSFQTNIPLALAGTNDICMLIEVTEICDCAEEYRSRISTYYCWC